jgi:MFS family permease
MKLFTVNYGSSFTRVAPSLLVFLALTLGFSAADLTNVRWFGGLVMVGIGAIAFYLMKREVGILRSLVGVLVVIVGFVVSHVLGSVLGSYGALFLVASVCAVVIFLLTVGFTTEKTAKTPIL